MVKKRDPAAIAEEALGVKARGPKKVPFAFVLDELEVLAPTTRPMFGCTAIYVGPRIVLVLRDGRGTADDGVWIATTAEHHASLRKELPSIRSITVFGPGESGWQVIPAAAESFEEEVLWVCELVRRADPRVGKLPKPKKRKSAPA
ncbi:MAG: hypothetical protein EPO40_23035 [Myxococcaceae bacterium]|nr:MAG: hypothetical protein EPO40_23035 [Myxococcaceae bacterium]